MSDTTRLDETRVQLKLYEEIDLLVDTDPLALRDYAFAVSQEVLRLTDEKAVALTVGDALAARLARIAGAFGVDERLDDPESIEARLIHAAALYRQAGRCERHRRDGRSAFRQNGGGPQ